MIPGDLSTPTGGYVYDRRIAQGMRDLGWQVRLHQLGSGFPFPSAAALEHARSVLERISDGALVLIDGLAMGAMPGVVAAESRRLRFVALVHHPLAKETGLSLDRERALGLSEREALAAARLVLVTSRYTGEMVSAMGVPAGLIHIVPPGTDPAPLATGSGTSTLNLLCVASLTPRKGHALLIDALAELKGLDWSLTCVGSAEIDPAQAARLLDRIDGLGLTQRVRLAGEVDQAELAALYHRADLFVLATRFEGFGMALAEALARGLPIVSTRTGAVPETVPTQSALLVPPDNAAALSAALSRVLSDRDLREGLARGAGAARERLTSWREACLLAERALTAIL